MLFYIIFSLILLLNLVLFKLIFISFLNFISNVLLLLLWIYFSWNLSQSLWRFKFIPKRCIDPKRKAVLITGCDTGFGHQLAKRLAKEGYHVFAGCLFPNQNGSKELKSEFPENISVIPLDVTKDESVSKARQLVQNSLKSFELWSVVNNAGILSSFELEFGDMSSFVSQMEVNSLGVVRTTKAFLPLLRESKGRVINMASLAGRMSIPGMVGYCMSKSAVISFSDGLRREMKKWEIDVICIEPHLFRTNLVNQSNHHSALLQAWEQTPEDIRVAYGDSYFHGYQSLLEKALKTARPAIESVVETMFNAVTHQSVSPYYRILGPFERLRVWMFEYLWPTRAMDWLSYVGCIWATGPPERLTLEYQKLK